MFRHSLSSIVAFAIVVLLVPAAGHAGPPYVTDDPEPVEPGHWEFYLATQHSITRTSASGTAPHVEVNYGALPGLQLHVIAPLAYAHPNDGPTFMAADGGTFPMFELPVGDGSKGLGTGHLHVLIPLASEELRSLDHVRRGLDLSARSARGPRRG